MSRWHLISPRSDLPRRRGELLDQEIDEGWDLGREMGAVWVDGVDGDRVIVGGEVAEQRHQRAVANRLRERQPRQAHDADALQGQLHLDLAFGDGDPSADLDLEDFAVA